jgi:NADP-dependent 3-hydroxy acid dehydrogenase YdfG
VTRTILITGATGAIGGALARDYAGAGVTLLLHGRDVRRLEEVAADCRSLGAEVRSASFDLRDVERLRAWVKSEQSQQPLDLVIANAGIISTLARRERENPGKRSMR